MSPFRVFVVDDHELVRRGLRDLLAEDGRTEVVGEAATVAAALERLPNARADVAVLDVTLPDGTGVDVCRAIRATTPVNCLMLVASSDDDSLFDAIVAGASGFVAKTAPGHEIADAVFAVASGQSLLDQTTTNRVLDRLREGTNREDRLSRLNPQERRILDLIGEGLTNRQIAEEIHLAEKTVKNYVSNLLAKLGMERRTQAAAYAARLADTRSE